MLYARALSRLARQLFADVIGDVYVEKELSEAPQVIETVLSDSQVSEITTLFNQLPDERKAKFLEWATVSKIADIKPADFESVKTMLTRAINE
jgi:hypothetical protein